MTDWLTMVSCRKDWKRFSPESPLMPPPPPQTAQLVKGLNWTDLLSSFSAFKRHAGLQLQTHTAVQQCGSGKSPSKKLWMPDSFRTMQRRCEILLPVHGAEHSYFSWAQFWPSPLPHCWKGIDSNLLVQFPGKVHGNPVTCQSSFYAKSVVIS